MLPLTPTAVSQTSSAWPMAFLIGLGTRGVYAQMLGQTFCGHAVTELSSDPTNIIPSGLTTSKGQVF